MKKVSCKVNRPSTHCREFADFGETLGKSFILACHLHIVACLHTHQSIRGLLFKNNLGIV